MKNIVLFCMSCLMISCASISKKPELYKQYHYVLAPNAECQMSEKEYDYQPDDNIYLLTFKIKDSDETLSLSFVRSSEPIQLKNEFPELCEQIREFWEIFFDE